MGYAGVHIQGSQCIRTHKHKSWFHLQCSTNTQIFYMQRTITHKKIMVSPCPTQTIESISALFVRRPKKVNWKHDFMDKHGIPNSNKYVELTFSVEPLLDFVLNVPIVAEGHQQRHHCKGGHDNNNNQSNTLPPVFPITGFNMICAADFLQKANHVGLFVFLHKTAKAQMPSSKG